MLWAGLLVSLLCFAVPPGLAQKKEGADDWQCVKGFWTNVATNYVAEAPCDETEVIDPKDKKDKGEQKDGGFGNCPNAELDAAAPKTCIKAPGPKADGGDKADRCWNTQVPKAAPKGVKLPLVVDMHGSGECAQGAWRNSGWGALADSMGEDTFITVWPQGVESRWNDKGTDAGGEVDSTQMKATGKPIPEFWSDVEFLTKLIATEVATGRVDPTRVYLTGFSAGCMMANRMALERSDLIAAFGCHGGGMQIVNENTFDLAAKKEEFNLLPMPNFITVGTKDQYRFMPFNGLETWGTFNGCDPEVRTEFMEFLTTDGKGITQAELRELTGCVEYDPPLVNAILVLEGRPHSSDSRMAEVTWERLKVYSRAQGDRAGKDERPFSNLKEYQAYCLALDGEKECNNLCIGGKFKNRRGKTTCVPPKKVTKRDCKRMNESDCARMGCFYSTKKLRCRGEPFSFVEK